MKTGVPTQILTVIPKRNQLLKGKESLSETVKFRLKIIDWYRLESAKYSTKGKPDVSLTCRHFGIYRSMFYRWYKRYNAKNIQSLENRNTKPKTLRQPSYDNYIVEKIRNIRLENPTYSKEIIHTILIRDNGIEISSSTIGRIIKKYQMFYEGKEIKRRKKYLKGKKKYIEKKKMPYNLRATKPKEIIEFDMKHINIFDKKLYALCGIDQYTRRAIIHISSRPSSICAREALKKIVEKFGKGITIVNDNGSENMGKAQEWLNEEKIEQLWTRPYKPKDKPFIERFIQTYEKECLNQNYMASNAKEMQKITDEWINKYENYRPHRSLNMLTPKKFESMILKSE